MTPEELREKVARAIAANHEEAGCIGAFPCGATCSCVQDADAALAVVREAMREPTMAMLYAVAETDDKAFAGGSTHGADFERLWAVALAASPLAEPSP